MKSPWLLSPLLLSCLVSVSRAEIPTIRHGSDLKSIAPLRINGWDVRLAFYDPSGSDGPWRVLYCESTCTGHPPAPDPASGTRKRGTALGPVAYEIDWGDGPTSLEL